MKFIYSCSSPSIRTIHFHLHPICDTRQIIASPSLSITRPTVSVKTRLHCRPDYNTWLIPKPVSSPKPATPLPRRRINLGGDTNQNTSSDILRLMDGLGLPVTHDIYASLVAECTLKRDAVQAAELLAHLRKNRGMIGFVNGSSGLPLLNRILMMFMVCGNLDVACQVFEKMPQRDSISLAIIIAGLVDDEQFEQALGLFVEMHRWVTHKQYDLALQVVMVCVLEACGQLKDINLGQVAHGLMLKMGFNGELLVATALMDFYGRCRCLPEANSVFFDQIGMADHRNTRIWNVAIVNNYREAHFNEVMWIFREMGRAGVKKNDQTFSVVLKACGRTSDGRSYGKQVHANAVKLGVDTHLSVMCSLVDMYGRCGLLKDARKAFDMIACEERNMACWSAMVTGFINHGSQIEAIKLLYEMKAAGLNPQQSLIEEVVLACGSKKLRMGNSGDIWGKDNAQQGTSGDIFRCCSLPYNFSSAVIQ